VKLLTATKNNNTDKTSKQQDRQHFNCFVNLGDKMGVRVLKMEACFSYVRKINIID